MENFRELHPFRQTINRKAMKKQHLYFPPLLTLLVLCCTNCALFHPKKTSAVCGPVDAFEGKMISNVLVALADTGIVRIYGTVLNNREPYDGMLLLTEGTTQHSENTFIAEGRYSLTLQPGTYALRIASESADYFLPQLELKPGEVRQVDLSLESAAGSIER
jgi:hypothetical protein